MTVAAHLRTTTYECMGIDHRAVTHISARVDVHGWHARNAASDTTAIADARAAGHNAHAAFACEAFYRIGGFIEERLPRGIDRHIHHRAHAEAEQDAFLDPAVDAPSAFRIWVWLGRAYRASIQSIFEALKQAKMIVGVGRGFSVEEVLDLSLQRAPSDP